MPWDLASARCVLLSVNMSAVVSRSISQSSNFEESCPSNMVISWSKDEVWYASPCAVHRVSLYVCIVVCMCSSLGLGWMWLEYHSERLQVICKLHQLPHMCR